LKVSAHLPIHLSVSVVVQAGIANIFSFDCVLNLVSRHLVSLLGQGISLL